MIRTAVYPPKPGSKGSALPDEWGDKIVKYIPAEVLAFYIPAWALVETQSLGSWFVFFVGLFGTIAYLLVRADRANPPRWYFYALAAAAFIAWVIGTTTSGAVLFHLPEWSAEVTVLGAVFLIPLIDEIVTKYTTPNTP